MIIKGTSLSGYRKHGEHLIKVRVPGDPKTAGCNDAVELVCAYNLVFGFDVRRALQEMAAVASGSRCSRFVYSSAISPDCPGGRDLSAEEAEHVAATLLDGLGFSENHQWFVVRHVKGKRSHFHVVANRVDPVSLKAVNLAWNYLKHEQVARRFEALFHLPPVPGAFTGRKRKNGKYVEERPVAVMSTSEAQQAARTGISVETVMLDLDEAWQAAGSGVEFRTLIERAGYRMARGERRDLVVVDPEGGVHSPARRLGLPARAFREKTRDLDPATLPDVAAVRVSLKSAVSDPSVVVRRVP